MWQAEGDTELTLSASPARAVGQSKLTLDILVTLANLGLNTVLFLAAAQRLALIEV